MLHALESASDAEYRAASCPSALVDTSPQIEAQVSVLLHPRLLFHVPRSIMLNAHQHGQHDRWDDCADHEQWTSDHGYP